MLGLALFAALGASTSLSLTLDKELRCPSHASLAERLGRVGLSVRGESVPVAEALVPVAFEVSVRPTEGGLSLRARRRVDGKVFERTVESASEDCPTVERLVVVLIHSWVNAKMPVLSPGSQRDAGSKR